MKIIIEHLEPQLSEWVMLEYKHINRIIGKENLIFTNVKNEQDIEILNQLGTVHKQSVKELDFLNNSNTIVLDPEAKKTLSPSDSKFNYFIFGGILGDYPMKKRTKAELSSKLSFPTRNLEEEQMSTDTAIRVSKKILEGKNFDQLTFADTIEIEIQPNESIILPYRYYMEEDIVFITPGLIKHLKNNPSF